MCELKVWSPVLTFSLVLGWIHFDNGVKYICLRRCLSESWFFARATSCGDEVGPEKSFERARSNFLFFSH